MKVLYIRFSLLFSHIIKFLKKNNKKEIKLAEIVGGLLSWGSEKRFRERPPHSLWVRIWPYIERLSPVISNFFLFRVNLETVRSLPLARLHRRALRPANASKNLGEALVTFHLRLLSPFILSALPIKGAARKMHGISVVRIISRWSGRAGHLIVGSVVSSEVPITIRNLEATIIYYKTNRPNAEKVVLVAARSIVAGRVHLLLTAR